MRYTQSIEHCFTPRVARADVEAHAVALREMLASLQQRRISPAAPLLALPFETSDLEKIEQLAADIRHRALHVVVIGSGGSGLNGKALLGLIPQPASAFHFLENIDPDITDALLKRLEMKKTCFIVISKSGATAETVSQFYVWWAHAEKTLGRKAKEHFFIITKPEESPLLRAAKAHGITWLPHAQDIGGRFSILTSVGLLAAGIAGLDIKALRRGAQTVVAQMDKAEAPADCPPALGAALNYAFLQTHHPMSVMMPYSSTLSGFAAWWRQCWAESLGKSGKGSTPIPAQGATDQHSQLQLYLDGPRDKLFTLITARRAGTGQPIVVPEDAALSYLNGKTIGDVMEAEQRATLETLIRHHCPVRHIALESLHEETLGALLMHVILEIIFMSQLMGVDPFDQPAVEEGKKLAREYLLAGVV